MQYVILSPFLPEHSSRGGGQSRLRATARKRAAGGDGETSANRRENRLDKARKRTIMAKIGQLGALSHFWRTQERWTRSLR